MGVKISGKFLGGLNTSMTHELSQASIMTDPPLDNNGEGKSFSPTDLLATAAGSCVMTIMAIYAKKNAIDLGGMACDVEKHMSSAPPRRVASLDINVFMPKNLSIEQRRILEEVGNSCPVLLSLSPDVKLNKKYIYNV
jgi:putative redox protein